MKAAVIAIGDEITSGQRLDTNSAWLSERLGELGIPVVVHLTAADELQPCTDVFRFAAEQADVVLATGGLGPTADDLTRDAIAAAANRELVLAGIRQMFASRGRPMADRNQLQAMFPVGSVVIPNPHGTAPGVDLSATMGERAVRWIALPGVPVEMREMWEQTVAPSLVAYAGSGRAILHQRIKCFGLGESSCEQRIPELIQRGRNPRVGITVHRATITLRITAIGANRDDCRAAMQPTIDDIHAKLGDVVFGTEDEELQDVVVRELAARGESLAVCETDTQGVLAHWLCGADQAANADAFRGAVVCDSISAARPLTGSDVDDVTSAAGTLAMARALRVRLNTDYALAVGKFPASDLESFHIALATSSPGDDVVVERGLAGHPDIRVERSVKQALDLIRRRLLGLDLNG
jgi:nicotinamide-nucleotide amidase